MKKITRQEWVAAARSGMYEQAYDHLRVGECYCIMGIGCDVADATWTRVAEDEWQPKEDMTFLSRFLVSEDRMSADAEEALIELNDRYRLPLDELGNLIEQGDDAIIQRCKTESEKFA